MSIEKTDFYQSLLVERQQRESASNAKRNEMGKDEFMKLLIAQLENQDPLQPTDNTEFIAQMAQFSSLEGITNLNQTVNQFATSLQSTQALQASTLVGRSVQVVSDVAVLEEGKEVNGTLDLKESSADVFVAVYASNGEYLGDISLGSQQAGQVSFNWNGLDTNGEPFPPGKYQFRAYANNNGNNQSVELYLPQKVNSVALNAGARGEILLNLNGYSEPVSLSQVKVIN